MGNVLNSFFEDDYRLDKYVEIKNALSSIITSTFSPLFFISPEIKVKSEIINSIVKDHESLIPAKYKDFFNLLSLNFNSSEIIFDINEPLDINSLIFIFAYYAKHNKLNDALLKLLKNTLISRAADTKTLLYISIFLSNYFTEDKNFDNAEKYLKYSLNFFKNLTSLYDYDKMIWNFVFGNFVSNTKSYFDKDGPFYYSVAERIALHLGDFITLNRIYNKCCYYYNSIENQTLALEYAKKAVSLSNILNIPRLKFRSYKNLSISYLNRSDYKNAFFYLKRTNILSNKLNITPLESARLQNTLGYLYYVIGKFNYSLKSYLKAFTKLYNVSSISDTLDESIKTFRNISIGFKMIGDYDNAIHFCKLSTKVIENITFKNKSFDIYSLPKQYINLSMLYSLYLDDYNSAFYYFNLSKQSIPPKTVEFNLLTLLKAYFEYKQNNLKESKIFFSKAYNFFMENDTHNNYIDSLFINFCVYFSKVYNSDNLLYKTECFSNKLGLNSHYVFYKDYFLNNKQFTNNINLDNYAFNFVYTLSLERHLSIKQTKKANCLKLLRDFSKKISVISSKKDLFEKALEMFASNFSLQGFIVTKYNEHNIFTTNCYLTHEDEYNKETLACNIESFITNNNLFLEYKNKEYDIFYKDLNLNGIKSMITYYVHDNQFDETYFFTIFNDYTSYWILTENEAKDLLILIKNLFLKLKNIQYTESIKAQSLVDSMTKLQNSKYFWAELENYIESYKISNTLFSMAMMDINDFKRINDTYGHAAGDDAIKFFSKLLKSLPLSTNQLIRYGGDEFIILFPNCKKECAYKYILKLKRLCNEHFLNLDTAKIKLDFAFGLLEFNKNFSCMRDFFRKVDLSMYKNKIILKNSKDISNSNCSYEIASADFLKDSNQ